MKDWQYQVMAAAFSEKYEGNQGIRLSETPVTWLAGEGERRAAGGGAWGCQSRGLRRWCCLYFLGVIQGLSNGVCGCCGVLPSVQPNGCRV